MYNIKYFLLKKLILTNSFKGINQYNYCRKLMHHSNIFYFNTKHNILFQNTIFEY